MTTSPCLKWLRSPLVALGLLLVVVLTCNAEPGWVGYVPTCLEDLQQLGPDQLTDLFMRSEVGDLVSFIHLLQFSLLFLMSYYDLGSL